MEENSYETVTILKPDLSEEGVKKVSEKVAEIVNRLSGKGPALKDLGKRQLAYRIAKQTRGHYLQLNYGGNGKVVDELERFLRLSEDVIRFLTVREEKRCEEREERKEERQQVPA